MTTSGTDETVSGFVRGRLGESSNWHLNRECPVLTRRTLRDDQVWCVNARTLRGLNVSQRDEFQRGPCRTCAAGPVLDDLGGRAAGPGHHTVSCTAWHGDGPCDWCCDLARYAKERNALVAVADGRVILLRTGMIDEQTAYTLTRLGLRGDSAAPAALPEISAPMWVAAAALIGKRTPLAEALTLAAALYRAPAHLGGPSE